MTAALVVQEKLNGSSQSIDNSPFAMFQAIAASGAGLDQIEKMMDLQEKWEKREAQKAYVTAMAAFKANPPKIHKDRHVQYATQKGKTDYKHASLGNVTEQINRGLGEHGLSAAWKTEQTDKAIKITCTITHALGHSESTSLTAFPDDSGGKNSIQAVGSTVSYLQRYTLLSLTGLATHDQDDDGKASQQVRNIDEKQIGQIYDMINHVNADEAKFLQYLGVGSIEDIPSSMFGKAMNALKAKEAKQ